MKETTMRQAHLGRYLGFQAYLPPFIQRLENINYFKNNVQVSFVDMKINKNIQPSDSADRKRFMQKVKRLNLESGLYYFYVQNFVLTAY